MEWVSKALSIGIGAALGANLRYFIGWWLTKSVGEGFPWGSFAVNLIGSFLIGIAAVLATRQGWSSNTNLFVVVGLLGGFTTFSAFSVENLQMLQKGRFDLVLVNVVGSVVLGLLLAWGGHSLAQKLSG